MRLTLCITALATAMFVAACASSGPGHGYRLVRSGGGQTSDLYSGTQRLGTVVQYSISPSGRYAMFDDAGRLRLFDQNSGRTHDVTDGHFAVPWQFAWDEAAGVVEVTYYQAHDPSKISLRR